MITLKAVLVTADDTLRGELEPLTDFRLIQACAALNARQRLPWATSATSDRHHRTGSQTRAVAAADPIREISAAGRSVGGLEGLHDCLRDATAVGDLVAILPGPRPDRGGLHTVERVSRVRG
jgi:hypothetical protein